MAEVQEHGDYQLKVVDFETYLIGPITARIVDADRLVRKEFANGFPNWAMYRVGMCGDSHLADRLRDWCIAFAVAYAHTGGLRKPCDDVAWAAGRDAYCFITTGRWGAPSDELAEALGIAPKTYRRFRNGVGLRLKASLDEYWIELQIAIRRVALLEKWSERPDEPVRLSDGRGFKGEIDLAGDGNYRAMPKNFT